MSSPKQIVVHSAHPQFSPTSRNSGNGNPLSAAAAGSDSPPPKSSAAAPPHHSHGATTGVAGDAKVVVSTKKSRIQSKLVKKGGKKGDEKKGDEKKGDEKKKEEPKKGEDDIGNLTEAQFAEKANSVIKGQVFVFTGCKSDQTSADTQDVSKLGTMSAPDAASKAGGAM